MPEGDSIFRAARTLHRALAGHTLVRFESVFPALNRVHEDSPLTGRTVDAVESVGKHLLVRLSGGHVLRTHMRMSGSWHIYRHGEAWQRPTRDMRILLATADYVAVGFNIQVAEMLKDRDVARQPDLRQLGPDLLSETFDPDQAVRRIRQQPASPIGDALLNQRLVAGIGNVYKSETLFACRIDPFVEVAHLDDGQLQAIVATARKLLHTNVTSGLAPMTTYAGYRRTTSRDAPGERLWVYGRARQPCRRCGTPIRVNKSGLDARLTYWCPICQKATQGVDTSSREEA